MGGVLFCPRGIVQRRGSGKRTRFPVEEIIQNRGFGKASANERVKSSSRAHPKTKTPSRVFLFGPEQQSCYRAKYKSLIKIKMAAIFVAAIGLTNR